MSKLQKLKLASNEPLRVRKAKILEPKLAEAILKVCESNEMIRACYLLDAKKPNMDEINLVIAIALDDEISQMDYIAEQFQVVLQAFPLQAKKTWILSAKHFENSNSDAKFYQRKFKN